MLKFNDYKDCLLNKKTIIKSQKRFKNEPHNMYTEEINKIALRSNSDKRYGLLMELDHSSMTKGKVYKTELLKKSKYKLLTLIITQMQIN